MWTNRQLHTPKREGNQKQVPHRHCDSRKPQKMKLCDDQRIWHKAFEAIDDNEPDTNLLGSVKSGEQYGIIVEKP